MNSHPPDIKHYGMVTNMWYWREVAIMHNSLFFCFFQRSLYMNTSCISSGLLLGEPPIWLPFMDWFIQSSFSHHVMAVICQHQKTNSTRLRPSRARWGRFSTNSTSPRAWTSPNVLALGDLVVKNHLLDDHRGWSIKHIEILGLKWFNLPEYRDPKIHNWWMMVGWWFLGLYYPTL